MGGGGGGVFAVGGVGGEGPGGAGGWGGVYVCHLFSLMMACGVVGLLAVAELVRKTPGEPGAMWGRFRKRDVMRLIVTGVAMAPWVLLALVFRPKVGVYPEVEYSLKD